MAHTMNIDTTKQTSLLQHQAYGCLKAGGHMYYIAYTPAEHGRYYDNV